MLSSYFNYHRLANYILYFCLCRMSRDSAVGIANGYGLDNRGVEVGLNPGRRGGKPATNRLSYGAAHNCSFCFIIHLTSEAKIQAHRHF
jgi:hypothetical protein